MNKKQKILIIISTIIFLFVTLNPSVFRLSSHYYSSSGKPVTKDIFFTKLPMYQYWAVIIVPTAVLYYFLKDKKDKKPKDEQQQ